MAPFGFKLCQNAFPTILRTKYFHFVFAFFPPLGDMSPPQTHMFLVVAGFQAIWTLPSALSYLTMYISMYRSMSNTQKMMSKLPPKLCILPPLCGSNRSVQGRRVGVHRKVKLLVLAV